MVPKEAWGKGVGGTIDSSRLAGADHSERSQFRYV